MVRSYFCASSRRSCSVKAYGWGLLSVALVGVDQRIRCSFDRFECFCTRALTGVTRTRAMEAGYRGVA